MSQSKSKEKKLKTIQGFSKAIAKYKNSGIKVGVFENRETDGLTTAQKLAILEFGATISQKASSKIPDLKQRKEAKSSFADKKRSTPDVSTSEHTIVIPAHAPFRKSIVKKKKEWANQFTKGLVKAIQGKKLDIPKALTDLGEIIAKDIRASIEEGLKPDLANAFLAGIRIEKTKDAITAVYVKDMRGQG